jgi:predicted RecA/RadA family phage recombinase
MVADAIVIVGSIVGVATGTASARAEVEIRPEGVYDLAKVPADALAACAIAKVDPATGIVGAAGTKGIAWIVAAAGAGSATARSCRGSEAAGSCVLNVVSRNAVSSTNSECWSVGLQI